MHEGSRECFWNISKFKVLLTTMEQRSNDVRHIVFTCVVVHNILRTKQCAGTISNRLLVSMLSVSVEPLELLYTEPALTLGPPCAALNRWTC